jgi:carotenoid 1,2-hydratase
MTERGQRHVQREARSFTLGRSRIEWRDDTLVVDLDERSVPVPHRVRGRVRLRPMGLSTFHTPLDANGRHRWGPIAPCARVEVELTHPDLRWQGHAYFDSNEGDEPIERAFVRWDWLRAPLPDGRCAVLYDVLTRDGEPHLIGARFAPDGSDTPFMLRQRQRLPPTRWWRVDRRVPVDTAPAFVQQTLEDTPFYARSLLRVSLRDEPTDAIHETLDVTRLCSPAVQWMLPWRMPRVG